MFLNGSLLEANCQVDVQMVDPKTQKMIWKVHENMTIKAPNLEQLTERADLYVGRPERQANVNAIRLRGSVTIIDQEKDILFRHVNTTTLDIHILKERSVPLCKRNNLVSGESSIKRKGGEPHDNYGTSHLEESSVYNPTVTGYRH